MAQPGTCKPDSLYNCNPLTSRKQYLDNKDSLLDSCDNCFPNGKYWCPVDGKEPTQISTKAAWDKIVQADIPGNIVNTVTDCGGYVPSKGKYYCVPTAKEGKSAYNCGQITTKSDYDKYITQQGGLVMDSCNTCYPGGCGNNTKCPVQNYCNVDSGNFECGTFSNRKDWTDYGKYATNKDCSTCFPSNKRYCDTDNKFDCGVISNRADWQKWKKEGKITDNCDDCYPKNKYVCDKKDTCGPILTLGMWKMNKENPYYDTQNECKKNCGKKDLTVKFPWGLYVLLLVLITMYIVGIITAYKKK